MSNNKSGFKRRFQRMVWAFLDNFFTGYEDRRLEQMAKYEIHELEKSIGLAQEALIKYASLKQGVKNQIENGQKEIRKLTQEIKAYAKINRELAGKLASKLEREEENLKENERQLATYEEVYQNMLTKIRFQAESIEQLKSEIKAKAAKMRVEQANAEVARALAKYANVQFGDGGVREVLNRMVEKTNDAIGAQEVIKDLSDNGLEEIKAKTEVQKALDEESLYKFELREHSIKSTDAVRGQEIKKTVGRQQTVEKKSS